MDLQSAGLRPDHRRAHLDGGAFEVDSRPAQRADLADPQPCAQRKVDQVGQVKSDSLRIGTELRPEVGSLLEGQCADVGSRPADARHVAHRIVGQRSVPDSDSEHAREHGACSLGRPCA